MIADVRERRRRRDLARRHALSKLARMYPAAYLRLYEAELEAAGIGDRRAPGRPRREVA